MERGQSQQEDLLKTHTRDESKDKEEEGRWFRRGDSGSKDKGANSLANVH